MRGPVSWRVMLIVSLPFFGRRLYFTTGSDAKAHELCVRSGPEPRQVRDLHHAVLDRDAHTVGGVVEIAEEAFQRDGLFLRGEDVERRQIARAEIGRMRHAGRAALLGAPADLPLRGEAVFDRARLQIIDP